MEGLGSFADMLNLAKSNDGAGIGELMALANNGGFGGQQWIWFLVIIFLLGGGTGFFGNRGNTQQGSTTEALAALTANDSNLILSKLNDMSLSQCSEFANLIQTVTGAQINVKDAVQGVRDAVSSCCCETNRNIDSVHRAVEQSACTTDKSIMQLGYNMQDKFCNTNQLILASTEALKGQAVAQQFANEQNFCAIRTQMATDTSNILSAIKTSESNVLGWLTNEKISNLQTENAVLRGQISQNDQTATIVAAINSKCSSSASKS